MGRRPSPPDEQYEAFRRDVLEFISALKPGWYEDGVVHSKFPERSKADIRNVLWNAVYAGVITRVGRERSFTRTTVNQIAGLYPECEKMAAVKTI